MLDSSTQYKLRNTHHSDEKTRLLRGTTNTSITDDADSEASSKTSETDGETSTKLNEALVQGHLQVHLLTQSTYTLRDTDRVRTLARDQDLDDETVDLEHMTMSDATDEARVVYVQQ